MAPNVPTPRLTGTYQIIGPWWKLWTGPDIFIEYGKPLPIKQTDMLVITAKSKRGNAMFHAHPHRLDDSGALWQYIVAFEPTETTKL